MKLIGITGTNGSGKGTVVEILKRKIECVHLSAREMIIDLAKRDGIDILNRDDLRNYNEKRNKEGKTLVQEIKKNYDTPENKNKIFIFESVRRVCEISEMKSFLGDHFLMVSIDTPIKERFRRITERGSMADAVSFEKFIEQERLENESLDDNQMNLYRCRDLSQVHLLNIGTMQDLEKEIDDKLLSLNFFSVI